MYGGSKGRDGVGYEKSRYGYDVPRIFSLTGHHPQKSLMNHIYLNYRALSELRDSISVLEKKIALCVLGG
jgi:hypothetical protein